MKLYICCAVAFERDVRGLYFAISIRPTLDEIKQVLDLLDFLPDSGGASTALFEPQTRLLFGVPEICQSLAKMLFSLIEL